MGEHHVLKVSLGKNGMNIEHTNSEKQSRKQNIWKFIETEGGGYRKRIRNPELQQGHVGQQLMSQQ